MHPRSPPPDTKIMQERDAAFAEVLRALFEKYPLPGDQYAMRRIVRFEARSLALGGRWRDRNLLPHGDWCVPPDEMNAVHALIYG